MKLIYAKDYNDLSRKAANILSAQVILHPRAVLGLATGSSPIGTYKQLIEWNKKQDVDFSKVTTVNLDEYVGLDPSNEQSYRYFMDNNFFNHININKANTNVPNGMAVDIEEECKRYDALINSIGGIDMQLLGIGNNGHIAFNEPDEAFEKTTHKVSLKPETIEANKRFFNNISDVPIFAITMGIKSIMQARSIVLIVNSNDKYDILKQSLFGPVTPSVPASILQMHSNLTVIYCCDKEL
ncbi:glucosamine-6-phosphate deaminase [Candidatus Epulonipiscium fishelsonii]|uniref:Glucosamine-6-phosphate deaminase n=1 Tax=Candidatus Epulonipiscium fishelsonii TaxID=77094 RepID=A0ACC8XC42_9FIRM|nr:glucosamine-6-phosphate deaminase [Epulopiscium sp. SCG-B11WGA-EpuloA1]ONI41355.1 glucosamine-6-phosphate deaminase [Epulopiscium sp. SCG-B05WGA-EpuloA1]ONI47225.1 glucosamine-6-phosphate deaminase [Epulopiscium sp. SCG-C06WGA-EpuloA1]